MKDGRPFVLGDVSYAYVAPNNLQYSHSYKGYMGVAQAVSYGGGSPASYYGLATRWRQLQYSMDRVVAQALSGIVSLAKTQSHYTFALRDDGTLFQCPLWGTSGNKYTYPPNGTLPNPKSRVDAMFELQVPFTAGTPKFIHRGGILETANGKLYYPKKKMRLDGDNFWDFSFEPTGIDTTTFGSQIVRIVGYVLSDLDNLNPTKLCVFILCKNGNLYASGDNATGWFGLGQATTSVPLESPVIINTNVADFDVDCDACIVMKKDGTMWATGNNYNSRLGLGAAKTDLKYYDWQQCVFTSL
jgi:hypothetical protein